LATPVWRIRGPDSNTYGDGASRRSLLRQRRRAVTDVADRGNLDARFDMRWVARFFQAFWHIRWQRLSEDQLLVVTLIAIGSWVGLGFLLLVAWVRIKFIRTVFADDPYWSVRRRTTQPTVTRPSSLPIASAGNGLVHRKRRQAGNVIQRAVAVPKAMIRPRISSPWRAHAGRIALPGR
jgi:hypothetical protein